MILPVFMEIVQIQLGHTYVIVTLVTMVQTATMVTAMLNKLTTL